MALVLGASRAVRDTRPRVLTWLALLPAQGSHLALTLVSAVSAALEFIGLTDEHYANTYYAAAVKSMLTSWHNFFFVSSDAGGFGSVDKPPLGLRIETISAKIPGFNSLSLLAPEALAGVLSVALLYTLISRPFGPVACLTAALALAITAVTAVTDRNNTSDRLLIPTLLLGGRMRGRVATLWLNIHDRTLIMRRDRVGWRPLSAYRSSFRLKWAPTGPHILRNIGRTYRGSLR